MKKIQLFILFLAPLFGAMSQTTFVDDTIVLNTTITPSPYKNYSAKEYVRLLPGFRTVGSPNGPMLFDATENVVTLNVNYLQPGQVVTPQKRDIRTNPTVSGVTGQAAIDDKGAAMYNIPIIVPPGTNGLQPNLSISYNSQSGMGNLGTGWMINCENVISRTGQGAAISLDNSDNYALNGNLLVDLNNKTGEPTFTTLEPTFSKIIAMESTSGTPGYFIVKGADGSVSEYGHTADSKLMVKNQSNQDVPLIWALSKFTDAHLNSIEYEYYNEPYKGRLFLKKIKYCTKEDKSDYLNEIQFYYYEYDTRLVRCLGANNLRQNVVCTKIKILNDNHIVNEYTFDYLPGDHPRLSAINNNYQEQTVNSCLVEWSLQSLASSGSGCPEPACQQAIKDYNGDGKDDIIKMNGSNLEYYYSVVSNNAVSFTKSTTISKGVVQVYGYFNNDRFADVLIISKDNSSNSSTHTCTLFEGSSNNTLTNNIGFSFPTLPKITDLSLISSGDYNSDGLTDFALKIKLIDGTYQKIIYVSNSDGTYQQPQNINNISDGKALSGNVFGDTKDELVVYDYNGGYRYRVFQWNGSSFNQAPNSIIYSNYNYCTPTPYQGDDYELIDYNGDGYCDLINPEYLYYSNGINGFKQTDSPIPSIVLDSAWIWDPYGQEPGYWEYYLKWQHPYGYDNYGNGLVVVENGSAGKKFFGDFNGDGAEDRVTKNSSGSISLSFAGCKRPEFLVSTITDGLDNSASFTYKPIPEASNYYHNHSGTAPLADFTGSIYCAQTMTTKGVGLATRTVTNDYSEPMTDQFGDMQKGFLGFKKIITTDDGDNTVTTKSYQFLTSYGTDNSLTKVAPFLKEVSTEEVINGSSTPLSKVVYTPSVDTTFAGVGSTSVYLYTKTTVANDMLLGSKKTTTVEDMNHYGQPRKVTTSYGSKITETVGYLYKESFTPNNDWIIGKLMRETTSKTHPDDPNATYTTTRDYVYYSNIARDLRKIIVNQNVPNEEFVSDEYVCNARGNITKHIQGNRFTTYGYDTYNRFQDTVTDRNGIALVTSHDLWGNVLSQYSTVAQILTTLYTYDKLGRLTKKYNPDGSWEAYTTNWADKVPNANITGALIANTTTASDGSTSTEVLDGAGKVLRTMKVNVTGNYIFTDYSYYADGKLKTETLPSFSQQPIAAQTTTYTYAKGKLESKTGPGVNLHYDYSDCANQYEVTETNQLTQPQLVTITLYNDAGVVKKVTEPGQNTSTSGNTIEYKYYASGNVKTVKPSGTNNTTTFYYDFLGRRTGIKDPSMNTFSFGGKSLSIRYNYNQWGELIAQRDAKGNYDTLVYDPLGRLTSKTQGGITTSYTYYPTGEGAKTYKLKKETNQSISYAYDYDDFGRLTTKTETIEGKDYTFAYTYDDQSRLYTKTYPLNGIKLRYSYNKGYLSQIADYNTNQEYWKCVSMNALDQYTVVNKGGLYQTTFGYTANLYQLDYIKSTKLTNAQVIQNMDYDFDSKDRNLNYRADLTRGDLKETFTYDDLDRLLTSSITKTGANPVNSSVTYSPGGKAAVISAKTGLGNYSYGYDSKPYQVSGVQNTSNLIQSAQTITYTAFNKVETFTDETKKLKLTITYGPDNQKKVSVLTSTVNNAVLKKRIYLDGFEIETAGQTKTYTYINSPTGVVGINVFSDETGGKYYTMFTDYLGSFNIFADASGNVVASEEMSFDAWGNRRSPSTWVNNASITSRFIRGFTGHEHWDELGVIDMGGRFYDPVLGLFLSPDPYVQNPTSSQNFNRYAYCNNNPLKYTDPDGNFFFLAPFFIGAAVSIATNGIINSINHRPFFEGALKQGLIGGIGGMAAFGIGNLADTWQLAGFGKVAFQTIAHGALGGTMSSLSGGKFEQGLLSGALGSLVASGAGKIFSGTGSFGQAAGVVIGGSLSGGIGATIAGGNFWDGFRNGAISAGLNHTFHSVFDAMAQQNKSTFTVEKVPFGGIMFYDENGLLIYASKAGGQNIIYIIPDKNTQIVIAKIDAYKSYLEQSRNSFDDSEYSDPNYFQKIADSYSSRSYDPFVIKGTVYGQRIMPWYMHVGAALSIMGEGFVSGNRGVPIYQQSTVTSYWQEQYKAMTFQKWWK